MLNNENFTYVKDGEISITEHFAQKQYVYPRHIYEGVEFFIDSDVINTQSSWLQKEFKLDCDCIPKRFCPDGKTYTSATTLEAGEILMKLWSFYHLPARYAIVQMKIYTIELIALLLNMTHIPQSKACTFITETQVDTSRYSKTRGKDYFC